MIATLFDGMPKLPGVFTIQEQALHAVHVYSEHIEACAVCLKGPNVWCAIGTDLRFEVELACSIGKHPRIKG